MVSRVAFRTLTTGLVAGASAIAVPAQNAWHSEKAEGYRPPMEIAPANAQTLSGGIQRAMQTVRVTASAANRENGKAAFDMDPATGEMIVPTARFYLPSNWRWAGPTTPGADSLGRPIVNERLGWASWTQDDVDA